MRPTIAHGLRLGACLVMGCASSAQSTSATTGGGPRGLRADEHRAAAAQQEALALEARTYPSDLRYQRNPGDPSQPGTWQPWVQSWPTTRGANGAEHDHLARFHLAKAEALHAEFTTACGDLKPDAYMVSPFKRFGIGGWNTSTGAIVYLTNAAGPAEALQKLLTCHRAWMMVAPATYNQQMETCPLDLPGLTLDARGDSQGITVSLGVRDAKLVPELQRRVAIDLEAAQHHK